MASAAPGPAGLAVTGVVVTEILQGLKANIAPVAAMLAQWPFLELTGFDGYGVAAGIYRRARIQGVTISTTDAIIAAVALENDAELFTLDKDLARLRLPRLRLYPMRSADN